MLVVILNAFMETKNHNVIRTMKRILSVLANILIIISLSYSQEIEKQKIGVTLFDKEKTSNSYRLYSSRNLTAAHLISPDGRYVHTWYYPHYEDTVTGTFSGLGMTWHYAEMFPNGHLLAIVKDEVIIELDWNSNLIWKARLRAHHDFARDNKENTIVVSLHEKPDPWNPGKKIFFDKLVEYNKKGDIIWEWNYEEHMDDLLSMVKQPLPPYLNWGDWPHINTCEILPENPIEKVDKRFKEGNLLICGRHANTIMIVEKKTGKIVWAWGPGVLEGPHMPNMLPNGNILIYDNGNHTEANSRGYTRAIEINPLTGKIVWEYGSNREFFSPARGSAIRMENGNTLIATSDYGWFFEVTAGGEKVWEYYNPDIIGNRDRMGLYRTIPYEKEFVDRLIARYRVMYYERNNKAEFAKKFGLSDKLLEVVKWIETGEIDKAHRWLNDAGLKELGDKEEQFAFSFLYAVRKDVKKSLDSAKKSIELGMPKAVFSTEFSDLFKALTDNPKFGDLE